MKRLSLALTLLALVVVSSSVRAAVTLNPLFGDGMVLQQGMPVPVWGTAGDGEKVTVRFAGQEVSTTAKDGRWMVRLAPLEAGGPFVLRVEAAKPIVLENVLVGEVWVCSGQSNMEFRLLRASNAKEAIAQSEDSQFRLFTVPHRTSDEPRSEIKPAGDPLRPGEEGWKAAAPRTSGGFSAVGYFFGRDLRKALGVPVGLIHSSVGGTPAEAWTPRPALEANGDLKTLLTEDAQRLAAVKPGAAEQYQADVAAYRKALAQAKAEGKTPPRPPAAPYGPNSTKRPTVLYNGMIAPLQPFAIRGVIWYQGEGNASRAYQYRTLFPTMIRAWRETWGEGDFPFLFVQLAPFQKIVKEPADSAWAELREAQLLTSRNVPNTGMAVITDVGDETDVHPTRKEPVGARLALAARALVYGQKVESSGPELAGMDVEQDHAVLRFRHTGGGLVAKAGPLTGFAIAGEDRKFHNADAEIRGDTVIVRSAGVEHPVAVRYGWANYPLGNLWNQAGLPASPFRTDDFPMTTKPRPRERARSR